MSFQEMKSWLLLEVETLEDTCRFFIDTSWQFDTTSRFNQSDQEY